MEGSARFLNGSYLAWVERVSQKQILIIDLKLLLYNGTERQAEDIINNWPSFCIPIYPNFQKLY
jgi:hypothetical protein